MVLEPACASAFKDELPDLFPDDDRAKQLKEQAVYFSDFMADGRAPAGNGGRKALVQIHCHQHAVIGTGSERDLLDRLGVDHEIAPSGCCGMAGAFGFAAETSDVSRAIGERVLLPMVRAAGPETTILGCSRTPSMASVIVSTDHPLSSEMLVSFSEVR